MANEKPNQSPPPLGETKRDIGVSLVKGAAGVIPFAGGIIGEIIGVLIPQQRVQRLETYVQFLNAKLDGLDTERRENLKDPESINLFEEGAIQSARALSDERRAHIAHLVAFGMTGDEKDRIEAKRLLDILGQTDDVQIIILLSYTKKYRRDKGFLEKNSAVLEEERPTINANESTRDKWAIRRVADDQLNRLGLLRPNYGFKSNLTEPEFDYDAGTLKARGSQITPLGGLLLRRLELVKQTDIH